MVPLLALPELLASLAQSINSDNDDALDNFAVLVFGGIICKLLLVALFLKGSTFVANYIVRAAIIADDYLTDVKGELFTLSVVAYALLVATVSDELSMSIEAGSVLAGIALYKSPHVAKVISSIQSITSVFGGMYLTSLGMIISPTFVIREFGSIVELVCLIGFFKLTLVSLSLHRFFGYAIKPSLAVGSAMAQISEVSLLVLAKSQRMGLIRRKTYLLLIPTTCIMLTLAPLSASMLRRLPNMSSGHDHAESAPKIEGRVSHFMLNLILRLRQVCNFKKKRSHHVYGTSKNVNGNVSE
jgi:Kef-type K+ transport system membrane component KefB